MHVVLVFLDEYHAVILESGNISLNNSLSLSAILNGTFPRTIAAATFNSARVEEKSMKQNTKIHGGLILPDRR